MKSRILNQNNGSTHIVVLERGESVVPALVSFVRENDIKAASFTAIGAFESAQLAFFDWERRDYEPLPVLEQAEVLVLAGDVAWKEDEPIIHAHAVLGLRDGSTLGGHLRDAVVRPTLEVVLHAGGALERRYDAESGLALVAP